MHATNKPRPPEDTMGGQSTGREGASWLARDAAYLWHPWSSTRATPETIVVVGGDGCHVTDIDGVIYLDAKSSGLNATLGYGCTPVLEAAQAQQRRLMTYDLGEGTSLPAIELAETIAQLAGPHLSRSFFCNSGSEAVEAAIRIARNHHVARGDGQRQTVVSLDRSYHGATMAGAAATGPREALGLSTPPGFERVPTPRSDRDEAATEAVQELFRLAGDSIAAILFEPVSTRTARPLSDDYVRTLRDMCDRHGALLIADEVTTGFGRTGEMFAHSSSGIAADILCTSKGLGAGYASIGAVTTTQSVFEVFDASKETANFVHGHTHSGHATACATALAVLDFLCTNNVLSNVVVRSEQLFDAIRGLDKLPGVRSVHGRGLLIGLEFVDPFTADAVRERMLSERVLVRRMGRTVVLAPPLIIGPLDAQRIADTCVRAVYEACAPGLDRLAID